MKCSNADCDRDAANKYKPGLCQSHHMKEWHQRRREIEDTLPRCSTEGCDKPIKTRGMCSNHYQAYWRKHIAPECTVEGCTRRQFTRGLSESCYFRLRTYLKKGQVVS